MQIFRKKSALILCDYDLKLFEDFNVDADAVLIVPDNGNRGPEKAAPKGGLLSSILSEIFQ